MSNERADWEHDQRHEEHILWSATQALEDVIKNELRDKFIDYLSVETREKLFEGYILVEYYETLKNSLDISRISNKLLQDRINSDPYD